jgi:hypothetical protein
VQLLSACKISIKLGVWDASKIIDICSGKRASVAHVDCTSQRSKHRKFELSLERDEVRRGHQVNATDERSIRQQRTANTLCYRS